MKNVSNSLTFERRKKSILLLLYIVKKTSLIMCSSCYKTKEKKVYIYSVLLVIIINSPSFNEFPLIINAIYIHCMLQIFVNITIHIE